MMLDDDPLFSEWSRSPPPTTAEPRRGSTHVPTSIAPYELDFEDEDPFPPVPPERRERLQRYVKMTVAGCLLVCMAGATRTAISRATAAREDAAFAASYAAETSQRFEALASNDVPSPTALPASIDPPVLSVPLVPPVPAPADSAAPVTTSTSGAAAPPAPTAAEPTPAPASPRPSPPAPVAAAPFPARPAPSTLPLTPPNAPAPSAPKTAAQERELARHALEHGKLRDAALAGEQAAAMDPGDAEAWLILGAAKQELGQGAGARAAFQSCAKSAKRGPVSECRAMLR